MPAENVVALTEALNVTPLEHTVGAEISGVDLSKPLSAPRRDEIHPLLPRHRVRKQEAQ